MIITSFEQFRYLPQNRGKDTKTIYNEWLLEESKLVYLMEAYNIITPIPQSTGLAGPAGGSAETPETSPQQEIITQLGQALITENGVYLITN
jgi:hypothetical protein